MRRLYVTLIMSLMFMGVSILGIRPSALVANANPTQLYFEVHQQGVFIQSFPQYLPALQAAKTLAEGTVSVNDQVIWQQSQLQPVQLHVPRIKQMPELPRGCEVVSLAMILAYEGVTCNPMQLAKEIKKDRSPYQVRGTKTYFGNPNDGFVGDMFELKKKGYGVYHGPITELANQYATGVVDMTGSELNDILHLVSIGHPVWVIHNVYFDQVPASLWRTWHTPSGTVKVTHKEHSVVIHGFDHQFIYITDPLTSTTKVERQAFERGWKQMGSQAIAIYRGT